jgi:pyruvate oxidase
MPPPLLLERAAAAINAAERPVILAGWGAFPASADVLALAQKIRAPILTTYRAKGILPEDNEWVIGILGNVGSPAAAPLQQSRMLITLGEGSRNSRTCRSIGRWYRWISIPSTS